MIDTEQATTVKKLTRARVRTPDAGLLAAISAAGSATKLAEALHITDGAISQWITVPIRRVLDVERITGVSRHDLRPDIYGPSTAKD